MAALFDDRVTAAYQEVLAPPRLAIAPVNVARLIGGITIAGEYVAARPLPVGPPNADDLPFAEIARAGRADALVAGNARRFAPVAHLVPVRSPRELLTDVQQAR